MNTLFVPTRAEWRAWLEQNHANEREIWLIFYKKHTGQPSLTYDEAVEEALCYGWIDSIVRRLDSERYAQKMTPRTNSAKWSETNRQRVTKLFREGRMTPAGMAKLNFNPEEITAEHAPPHSPQPVLAEPLLQILKEHPQAWINYNLLAPSHRRQYTGWIMEAKKEETRLRRLQESIDLLAQGQKLETKWFKKK